MNIEFDSASHVNSIFENRLSNKYMFLKLPDIALGELLPNVEKGVLWVVQCLACASVAWLVSQSFWGLVTSTDDDFFVQKFPILMDQRRHVVMRHFFDVVAASNSVSDSSGATTFENPDARWRLQGTYVGRHGRAMLSIEGGVDVEIVKVGGRLSSGHEVVDVRPGSIVISKDGQESELLLRPVPGGSGDHGLPEYRLGTTEPSSPIKESR